jgi:hypothetical protein
VVEYDNDEKHDSNKTSDNSNENNNSSNWDSCKSSSGDRSNKVIMLSRSTARSSTRSIMVEYDKDETHDSNKTSNNNNENNNSSNWNNSMSSFGDSSSKLPITKLKSNLSSSSHESHSSRTSISSMASSLHHSNINDKYSSFSCLLDANDSKGRELKMDGHYYGSWQQRLVPLLFTMCLLGWTGFLFVTLHLLQQVHKQSDINNVSSDAHRLEYPTLDVITATSTTAQQLRARRKYNRGPKEQQQQQQRVVESSSSLSSSRKEDSSFYKVADITVNLDNGYSRRKVTTTTAASLQQKQHQDT